MIIITGEEITLESIEIAELDSFLRTRAGQRIMKAVAAMRPPIVADPFSSGRAAGYEEAIANLIELTKVIVDPVVDKVSSYPDLDRDDLWEQEVPGNGDAPTKGE